MAPQTLTVEKAIDRDLERAEKAGCGPDGHAAVLSALHLVADEVSQGNADNKESFRELTGKVAEVAQQVALLPAVFEGRMAKARAESRIAPLWEIVRALPLPWRVALLVALLAGGPSAFVATVGAVAREMLRAPATMSAPDIAGQVGQVGP